MKYYIKVTFKDGSCNNYDIDAINYKKAVKTILKRLEYLKQLEEIVLIERRF